MRRGICREAMVLPGFTDSHMHLLHYAMIQKNLSLFGVASIGEIIDTGAGPD